MTACRSLIAVPVPEARKQALGDFDQRLTAV